MTNQRGDGRAPSTPRSAATSRATEEGAEPSPLASRDGRLPAAGRSSSAEVDAFLRQVKQMAPTAAIGRGRLVFAMDATMSRQPTWDMALGLQAGMFDVVREIGGLDVQLVYFRGNNECRASRWVADPSALARLMTTVDCRGGYTQIGKVLSHVRSESERERVNALVYVGDCMEEQIDDLCGRAGELALIGVPVFLFQEGNNRTAASAFGEIARLTRGAYCRFDDGSAEQLKELLKAVAVFAAGGRQALQRLADGRGGDTARRLLADMTRN